jgi:predicted ATPase/DNA-binding XRE family transcriptional regulator
MLYNQAMKDEPFVLSPESFATLGDLLRYLRERARLSQRELAAQVNYHYSTISRIEKNTHSPDVPTLMGRFVPALELDDKPEWIARLRELALPNHRIKPDPLAAAPALSDSDPAPLPTVFTPLLGRERETDALWEMLRRADVRLVTLVGPPGVGKTRLAIHAAGQVSSWFPDGVVFADLAPVTSAGEMIGVVASALGIPETSGASNLASVQSRLRNQRLLLVLDNFEQVMPAAPQIAKLLAASPDLKIIATSRESLRISAEHVFPLQPLPLPERAANVQALLETPVIRLFVDRARSARPDFALTEENASDVTEICARLDGLPLAIELAAARVTLLTPRDMLNQLDRRFQWLTDGARDNHAWRQTLRGALDWSYNLLDKEERALLHGLSIFSGGWTLPAAEAVCSQNALPLLSQLVNKSLVVAEPEQGRYRLFDTMREFAREKIAPQKEEDSLRARHLAYYADWVEEIESKLDAMPLNESRRLVEAERNNLYGALHWALDDKSERSDGLRLITAAAWIWFRHSHFSEGADWAERFLPLSADKKFQALRARLLYRAAALAEFAYWREKYDEIKAWFDEAESLARKLGDKLTLAHALYLHTEVFLDNRDWENAARVSGESASLCRDLGQMRLLCLSLSDFGMSLHEQKKKKETRAALDEALEIALRERYIREEGYVLRRLVHCLRKDGDYAEAIKVNQRALKAIRASGDRINIGQVQVNMAILASALDDFAMMAEFAHEAYDMFQSIGSEFQQPFPERLMGYASLHMGDAARARQLCVDSIRRNVVLGEDHLAGVYGGLLLLAEIELAEENFKAAARLFGFVRAKIQAGTVSFQEPDMRAMERLQSALEKKKVKTHASENMKLEQILAEFIKE